MKENIKKYVSQQNISIIEAMKIIDSNAKGILYIIEDDWRLVGSVSDGDIRRWIIKTGNISGDISGLINHEPKFVRVNEKDAALSLMEQYKLRSVPVVDANGALVDIMFGAGVKPVGTPKTGLEDIPIVIMAGGKGTRLYPFTKILPKPLIPIGDVPILERIMDNFHDYGADDFYLVVNYKKEMIRAYFNEQKNAYKLNYIDEETPLGTAGGLRLIDADFQGPLIISNCDVIVNANYGEALKYHVSSGNDITIISSIRSTKIPYGVIRTNDEGLLESIDEKPNVVNLINTGLYIINPVVISMIPEGKFYNMTDVISDMIERKMRVGTYPIGEEAFLDMGEFEEMKRMEELIKN
jgi:dTDP-glucose pyrophosphorylase